MKKILIVTVLIALSACAGKQPSDLAVYDYHEKPELSKAMNIAVAFGLTTENGPLKDSKPLVQKSGYANDVVTTTEVTANVAANTASLISDASSVVGVLSSLGNTEHQHQSAVSHIYAFLPFEKSSSEKDAKAFLNQKFLNAIYSNIKKQGFQHVVVKSKIPGYEHVDVDTFIGNSCGKNGVSCTISGGTFYIEGNLLDKTPTFISSSKAWFFSGQLPVTARRDENHQNEGIFDTGATDLSRTGLNEAKLFKDMSADLGNNLYFYTPHGENGQPTIYHNGEALLFIKPNASQLALTK